MTNELKIKISPASDGSPLCSIENMILFDETPTPQQVAQQTALDLETILQGLGLVINTMKQMGYRSDCAMNIKYCTERLTEIVFDENVKGTATNFNQN